ncbi:MAG: acyloxyacyl hydrolase [Chthoniobacteraceae bacterium]
MKLASFAAFLVTSILPSAVFGGTQLSTPVTTAVAPFDPFEKGRNEVNVLGGYFYSPVMATGGRPVLKYAQGDLMLGWMLTSPAPGWGQDWLRGNWEALANVFGANSVKGPSGFMAGGRLLFRYNFVQPQARWVPFIQVGGGGLGNNIYKHEDQRVVGSGFEFTLVADGGVRYFITPNVAALLMVDFEHISNANTACRNLGINALGGMAGIGVFF